MKTAYILTLVLTTLCYIQFAQTNQATLDDKPQIAAESEKNEIEKHSSDCILINNDSLGTADNFIYLTVSSYAIKVQVSTPINSRAPPTYFI